MADMKRIFKIEEELHCLICLDVADNAVETSCCHHIFCEACLKKITKNICPMCRSRFKVQVSHTARRIINHHSSRYTNINTIDNGPLNASQHDLVNQYQLYVCPIVECSFYGDVSAYLHHLTTVHADAIVKNSHMVLTEPDNDLIGFRINTAGRKCRIGLTGKYYCNGSLGEFECSCCDGICGPKNGCNCKHCMSLDIQIRKLPVNYLVNRDGMICRRNTETGHFYCGRFISENDDETCGPIEGSRCRACLRIHLQAYSRYGDVWSK